MASAVTSASIVALDPAAVAARDAEARSALSACRNSVNAVVLGGVALTVPYSIQVLATEADRKALQEVVESVWALVDNHLNEFNDTSEVSQLNRAEVGTAMSISDVLWEVLHVCLRMNRVSGGLFNPCFAALQRALVLKQQTQAPAALDATAVACEMEQCFSLSLPEVSNRTATRLHEHAALGLGGVSKGWAVDKIAEKFRECGFANALVDWGGEMRALGSRAPKEPWKVGIVAPPTLDQIRAGDGDPTRSTEQKFLRVVALRDGEALATSGDYAHMLDREHLVTRIVDVPRGELLCAADDRVAQVTVVAARCVVADALATAALLHREIPAARRFLMKFRVGMDAVTDFTIYQRREELLCVMPIVTEVEAARLARMSSTARKAKVVVVGGGLAGLAAAIEAVHQGAHVLLCEKSERLGGNSSKATTGCNGCGTRSQAALAIDDEIRLFEKDTLDSAVGGSFDPAVVRMLAEKSADAIHWLIAESGVSLSQVKNVGGHSRARTHRVPDRDAKNPVPIGFTIMSNLIRAVCSSDVLKDSLEIRLNTAAVGVNEASGIRDAISSVTLMSAGAREIYPCDAVVLTTGGFGNDRGGDSLISEYVPRLMAYPTTHGLYSTGDGIKIGRALGAKVVDMDRVVVHPIGFIDPKDPANRTKYLGPEALRVSGFILVQPRTGKRFANEVDRLDNVSNAICQHGAEYPGANGARFAYCIIGAEGMELFGAPLYWYRDAVGLFAQVANVQELADHMQCDVADIQQTLEDYNRAASTGRCDVTGRTAFPCRIGLAGPFAVAAVTPSIHYTMGGLLINAAAEVQRDDTMRCKLFAATRSIQGLFAAGEVSAGLHGRCRLGGNTLLESIVFGRIAGDRAACLPQRRQSALLRGEWTWLTVREVRTGDRSCGLGSTLLVLNLPGSVQQTGLKLGEYVTIRTFWDGRQVIGHYSPITLPDDLGVIGLLARSDKGCLRDWLTTIRPGDAVEATNAGGLALECDTSLRSVAVTTKPCITGVRRLSLVAGGTGLAPMLQLLQAVAPAPFDYLDGVTLIYAAETEEELSFRAELEDLVRSSGGRFRLCFVLHFPPSGWNGAVGFVTDDILRLYGPPPSPDLLTVISGPPIMQTIVLRLLAAQGHAVERTRTVDEGN